MPTSLDTSLEPRLLTEALEAVAELNGEWLEALKERASQDNPEFPLPATLRSLFASLTRAQCRERGQCGVLLVDGGFTNVARWQVIADSGEVIPISTIMEDDAGPPRWLPYKHAIVLAHSTLLVTWQIVHSCPAAAGVLLGMSEPVVQPYGRLSLSDLSRLARSHPGWFRPRWSDRPDIWAGILQSNPLSTSQSDPQSHSKSHSKSNYNTAPASAVLHCLKLSATGSARVLSSSPGMDV